MALQVLRDKLQQWRAQKYLPVAESDIEHPQAASQNQIKSIYVYTASLIGILFIIVSLAQIRSWPGAFIRSSSVCKEPSIRREWRSLTPAERADFIQAFNCLSTVPARWGLNGTLYDDFALLHGRIGSWCHRSASFFPWHRNTLFIWENALRDYCGFSGQIPYWDWSLDWMDLAKSSIWDNSTGFGGDGDQNGPETVGEGRCVTDGPFSELRPIVYNHTFTQHCLSRGFRDEKTFGRLPSSPYSPDSIGRILRESTYKDFVRNVEYYLHNTMHTSIAGDFLAMTAANDPIFFLHHAQLDRLWWRWQQEDTASRLIEYHGKHMFNSTGESSLSDLLMYAGFDKDIPVADVMNTESGILCYRY